MYLLIMGRLIISETEKKNILSLYESTNVVPPPSESVLVENVNPFKEPKYQSITMSEYKPDLKNGSLFFVLDENKIELWVLSIINNDLSGKTIRLYNDYKDEIKIIPKFEGYGTYVSLNKNPISIKDKNKACIVKISTGTLYSGAASVNSNGSVKINYPNDYDDLNSSGVDSLKIFNSVISKILWSKVPDEYFEIRKIQRQQTDF